MNKTSADYVGVNFANKHQWVRLMSALGLTQKEVGEMFELCEASVSKILSRASEEERARINDLRLQYIARKRALAKIQADLSRTYEDMERTMTLEELEDIVDVA